MLHCIWFLAFAVVAAIRWVDVERRFGLLALAVPVGAAMVTWASCPRTARRRIGARLVAIPLLALGCNWLVVFSVTDYREHLRGTGLLVGCVAFAIGWLLAYPPTSVAARRWRTRD